MSQYLKSLGWSCIHYYFKQSGVSEPVNDIEGNWNKLQSFIESGEYNAFSDYPTRTFYKQLMDNYSSDYFILTTRSSLEKWRKSMKSFFIDQFSMNIDIDRLAAIHERLNKEIRDYAQLNNIKLLDICIEQDADDLSDTIKTFLEVESDELFPMVNSSSSFDTNRPSGRLSFFDKIEKNAEQYFDKKLVNGKAVPSEYGWVYLFNDASNFFPILVGEAEFSERAQKHAIDVIEQRAETLGKQGILYRKIIVPEKAVVYPEFLPKNLIVPAFNEERPAVVLSKKCPDVCTYLKDSLIDAKAYGLTYFRGDSHTNWTGAYFAYVTVMSILNKALKEQGKKAHMMPKKLSELTRRFACYNGDLFAQMDDEYKHLMTSSLKQWLPAEHFEELIQIVLPEPQRTVERVPLGADYDAFVSNREWFRFKSKDPNSKLPKAVVFRDSVVDLNLNFFAEHFSESLFIWKGGHVYQDVIEKEKPDVVLHFMAERFVSQYAHCNVFDKLGV